MAQPDLKPILHKIRVKLHQNNLTGVQGAYIARTNNEKSLSIEDVCCSAKTRGGVTSNYEDMAENVRQYYAEMAFLLCDGYAVNNGYYCIHTNIGGTFDTAGEMHNHEKHPISFRFRTRSRLRKMVDNIAVVVEGVADSPGYIDSFTDFEEALMNKVFLPGNQFAIHGSKIKIAGDDGSVGVYFVPVDDPSKAVKVTRLAENTGTKVTGIAPKTGYMNNRIEIRTQYAGSGGILLKTPRVISSNFVLEAG